MSITTIIRRVIAVLKVSSRITQFISEAEGIVEEIGNHATLFPTPSPTLASVTAHIDDLHAKQLVAQTRLTGAVQARNAAKRLGLQDLRWLRNYVQEIADADPDNAEDIILQAGLKVKTVTARVKADFAVKNGKVSGSIELVAKAGPPRSSHDWQTSLNGTTWTDQPSTLQAKTVVSGFSPGIKVYCRHRLVTKEGPASWSQTLVIIVV